MSAVGGDTPLDADGFAALLAKISRDRGFVCASYKERCLKRRVGVRMRARGLHRYEDYSRLLDSDAAEYERLLDALTINVTKLFRNWDVYDAIARQVIPALWESPARMVRVWSAGCSSGEEPYSLAVLFHRHAEIAGALANLDRVQIVGTDIDSASLEAAKHAKFDESSFSDTPQEIRHHYFAPRAPFALAREARKLVRFQRLDLLREPAPFPAQELIICRNVLIYFDRRSQEDLVGRFHEVLAPGGFLVLGKVETLLGPLRARFTVVNARERIFRRA